MPREAIGARVLAWRRPLLAVLLGSILPAPRGEPQDEAPASRRYASPAVLLGVCRLWGTVRDFHPALATPGLDWDLALVRALPAVERSRNDQELALALGELLAPLEDPATRVEALPGPAARPARDPGRPRHPHLAWPAPGVALVTATDYGQVTADSFHEGPGVFARTFLEGRTARAMVLDLRRLPWPDPGPEDEIDGWSYAWAFRSALALLLDRDLVLAAHRCRFHSGFPPQVEIHRELFLSGVLHEEHPVLQARGRGPGPRLVCLVNEGSRDVLDVLAGLQGAGAGVVVFQGEEPRRVASTFPVVVTPGLRASVRVADQLNPDGSTGFLPDLAVPDGDEAMARALALARGDLRAPPASRQLAPPVAPVQRLDDPPGDSPHPERETRILSLFRLWSVVDRFYPYRELIPGGWDDAFRRFLPRFAEAESEEAYHLAVAELLALLPDSHVVARSPFLDRFFGTHVPPLTIRFLGEEAVVAALVDEEDARQAGIDRGDSVLAVDGVPTAERCRRLRRLLAASTPQALRVRLADLLLAGPAGSRAELLVEPALGSARTVRLTRTLPWPAAKQGELSLREPPPFGLLPGTDVGYVDLARLERSQVEEAFTAVGEARALILDVRGYPKGTAWLVAPRLAAKAREAAIFLKPLHFLPHPEVGRPTFLFHQPTPPPLGRPFPGPVAALIDGETMSQGEHTVLYLKSARPDLILVGGPTAGSHGDITNLPLPGGILVYFSGHGVTWPDGRPIQGVGIAPDLPAAPTREGVRAGRDEVLQAALARLRPEKP